MSNISNTPEQQWEMLVEIGLKILRTCFRISRSRCAAESLDLPEAIAETEMVKLMKEKAQQNCNLEELHVFGGPVLTTFLFRVIDQLISRQEFIRLYSIPAENQSGTLIPIFVSDHVLRFDRDGRANASMFTGKCLAEAACWHARQ